MNLEEQSRQRKARLAALRNAKASVPQIESANEDVAKPSLRFRNYQPISEDLQKLQEEAPTVGPTAKDVTDTVEGQTEIFAQQALEEEQQRSKEVDLQALAPKKPNWDLKRDLETKMEKLERRTQAAIADLIRERLQKAGDVAEAAGAADAERTAGIDLDDDPMEE
ncbi:Coiled-coil domain-containing protein 12 [Rhizophlyctis rosea]|nr:Coiled-coil domain-containing protein 12 [Rhizophlyctis rosea]